MVVDLIVGLLSIFFLVFIVITWNNDYWLKRSIPYVEPHLFFGNIRDVVLMKRTIGEVYNDVYKKLSGKPLGGFFKLRQPILMIREPELVRQVLVEKFDCFQDNDIQVRRDTEPILKMNPFLAKGQTWKPLRHMVENSLKTEKVQGMISHMDKVCRDMVDYIYSNLKTSINVEELSGRFTTDVVASCSFGKETNSFSGEPEFRRMTKRLFNSGVKSNLAVLFAFYAPFMSNIFKFRIVGRKLAKFFTEVVTQICRQRVTEKTRREDFLQGLIDINKESEAYGEGEVFKFEEIAGHCLTFLVDGYYTSAESLTFCLYELAQSQEAQKKARGEIMGISSNISFMTFQDWDNKLPYLDRVIKECGRLHPPIQTMTRICNKGTDLSFNGLSYTIPQGIPVTIPVYSIHMDPQYFSKPEEFQPERFIQQPTPHTYLPYGEGPRACPGVKFSQIMLKMAIAAILTNFIIVPRDRSPITLDPQNSFLRTPKGGVWMSFKPI